MPMSLLVEFWSLFAFNQLKLVHMELTCLQSRDRAEVNQGWGLFSRPGVNGIILKILMPKKVFKQLPSLFLYKLQPFNQKNNRSVVSNKIVIFSPKMVKISKN
jgi:hypothetical protein